jgi:hypothetical protein
VLTSSDGVNWVERTLPASLLWTGLAYGDGIWMAAPYNGGQVAVSADGGLTWAYAVSSLFGACNDLAVLNNLWMAVVVNGGVGSICWSMDRGANWTRGPAVGNHRVATAGWNRVLAADNRLMVAHTLTTLAETALSQRAL